MRLPGMTIVTFGLVLFGGAIGHAGPALAEVSPQVASPVATPAVVPPTAVPPTATPVPAAVVAASTAVPAATIAADVQTDVVTLVMWYVNDPSGEIINIVPLGTDSAYVAGPQVNSAVIGNADFPVDGSPPTISLGETLFTSYPRSEGDIPERWTWFDDFEGARPATLVMQVSADGGAYTGYYGSVTFVSRDDAAGGVMIFALRPPGEPAPAEAAVGDAAVDEAGAVVADAAGAATGEEAVAEAPVVEEPILEEPAADVPVEEQTAEAPTEIDPNVTP